MKWFLITLAIGLASSDKLDHTYLPPPGAQFAGGILGNQDAPLEPPHHTHPGTGQIIPGHEQHHPSLGVNGEPVNFGDKIPKVPFNYNQENLPTTTTSYAFSQTTTYPPTEGFNPANLPINPVTGLPILLDQENVPFGSTQGQQNIQQLPGINQGQNPVYGTNLQSGVIPQGPNTISYNQPGFNQPTNQISGQYPGQNLINPSAQIPGSVNQFRGQNQGELPIGQGIAQQGFLPTGTTNQPFNQYPVQNLGNNGGVVSIPGSNQGLVQYPSQDATNQGLVPSTVSPINSQSGANQYGANYDGSQGPLTQGTYTGQPINVGEPQLTQTSYQNQGPFNTGGISQYSTEHPNVSGPRGQGSSPSYNAITSTTPFPAIPSSTSGYSSVRPVYRPERPQAEADRKAVILNYENIRTPNGYSYSFDTSNGIHADESGIVDNGTKAQGSYSYIGDDGKLYSVYYTADENGFQPRGDHLPTPPPIPEAIQRVIEQAAKDEAVGIVDDGSYDEFKYGDDKYQGISKQRRPQNQGPKTFGLVKPITGIKDVEYDEGISQNQFDDSVPVSGVKKGSDNNLPVKRPSNKGINESGVVDQEIRRISDNSGKPIQDFHERGKPVEKQGPFNRGNSQNKQATASISPVSNRNNIVFNDAEDEIDNKDSTVNNQGFSSRRPISDGGKDALVTKYPGANVDVTTSNYPKTESDGFVDNDSQTIVSSKPGAFDEYDDNKDLGYDSITGAPIVGGKKQTLTKRIKGTSRPGSNSQNENLNLSGHNDVQENAKIPSISEYIENAAKQPTSQQQTTQQGSGYHYQQPSTTFEQNTFPTRFRPQEIPTTIKPDQRNTEYIEGTTRKPFMTPNVYEQNEKASPSTTRKPFTTKGVTSPSENAYTDYKDDDYATDLDIDDERNSSTKMPVEKSGITRPYETTRKGSRPQYGQNDRKSGISQKQPSKPGHKTGNTEAVAPGYTYGPTTSTLTHHSRFGTTESPQNIKLDGRRPSSPNFEATTAVGTPVTQSSLGQTAPNYKYQSTDPNSKYFDSNVVSGYPTSRYTPGLGSTSGTPAVSTPQNYYTSTFRPSQSYSTTSSLPISGYQPGSGVQFPVGPTGSPVPTQDNVFHTGYHYGPPKSGNPSFGHDAGFFTPTDSSRVSPTSPTGTYQTTFQGPGEFPSTTSRPSVGGKQNNFIPSYQGSTTSPLRDHQGNFQNQPSTPGYSTTIMASTPGRKTTYDYPGSPITYKDTTRYEYGPSRPNYSTTNSPSTIGTTPAPYNPTGATIPSQGSTTYRPVFQNTEDLYVGGPVDGFGRPIPTNQGSNTGFTYPTQSPIGSYNGPNFGGNQPSTSYPGEQPRVIGEDFSGPKQPQRFDPKTGYHYK